MRAIYSPSESVQIVGSFVKDRVDGGESVEVACEEAAKHYELSNASKARSCYDRTLTAA
jgi:hypothetical protein